MLWTFQIRKASPCFLQCRLTLGLIAYTYQYYFKQEFKKYFYVEGILIWELSFLVIGAICKYGVRICLVKGLVYFLFKIFFISVSISWFVLN